MSLLAPLFLIALAGLAGPILLHLTRQERGRPVRFPSLMFLEKIPFQETSRRRIRHWLLLCLRLAALALLIAAFARPFVRGGRLASVGGPAAEEVAVLLDQSWSMEAEDRWEDALDRTREVLGALRPRDRASLIVFSETPALVHRSIGEPARIVATLDTLSTTSLATRFAPAVKLAATTLAASELPRKRLVLVSDFQRTGWRPDPDARVAEGVVVESVVVGGGEGDGAAAAGQADEAGASRTSTAPDEEGADSPGPSGLPPANLALADLEIGRQGAGARDRVTISARLINTGTAPVAVEVVLAIDETDIETAAASVPAQGAAAVTFPPFTLAAPFTRGEVRIAGPDGGSLAQDDRLWFVTSPGGDLRVVIVDAAGAGDSNLYLRGALGISEGAGFAATVRRGLPDQDELAATDVVVLNGAPFPGGASGDRLRDFVEAGGGLLVVLGDRSAVPSVHADFLPAAVGGVADAVEERHLGFVDYDHAVFEAFRGERSGDFSRALFHRVRSLDVLDGQVLARFDDGAPALVEGRRGRGRVLVWATGMDRFWNDLALQPVFLPFVHRATRYLGGRGEAAPWHLAGTTVDLAELAEAGAVEIPADAVAMEPGGGWVALDGGAATDDAATDDDGASSGAGAAARQTSAAEPASGGGLALALDRAGIWEIRPPGSRPDRPFALAANVDIAESDLTRLDVEAFQAAVGGAALLEGGAAGAGGAGSEPGAGAAARITPAELDIADRDIESSQSFWRYLIAAVFVLLAVETVLSNRLSRERIKEEGAA